VALWQAILERPDDDLPRLAYADWLEENGEEKRARFIRLQLEKARLPSDDPRRIELLTREKELLDCDECRHSELPRLKGIGWKRFWRGFVSGAEVSRWRHFRSQADALFAATPIQFLRFQALMPEQCQELAASPYLARLTGLDLNGTTPGDAGVAALAGCPFLASLQFLGLNGPHHGPILHYLSQGAFGNAGAYALASSPYLNRLERLTVSRNFLSERAWAALLKRFGDQVVQRLPH
jgi:uncharacterized protein (TIGR02996 family)